MSARSTDQRRPKISQRDLASGFNIGAGALWRNLGQALNEMFIVRCNDDLLLSGVKPPAEDPDEVGQEDLTLREHQEPSDGAAELDDWDWYCPV